MRYPKVSGGTVFNDDQLNSLEKQSMDANQTIKIPIARLQQARATAAIQISTLFPSFGLQPGTTPSIGYGVSVNGSNAGTTSVLPFVAATSWISSDVAVAALSRRGCLSGQLRRS